MHEQNTQSMYQQAQHRLEELRQEFDAGKRAQAELDAKRDALTQTMLRISGAMQVLHELLATNDTPPLADPARETTGTSAVRMAG